MGMSADVDEPCEFYDEAFEGVFITLRPLKHLLNSEYYAENDAHSVDSECSDQEGQEVEEIAQFLSKQIMNDIDDNYFIDELPNEPLTPEDPNQYLYSKAYKYRTSGHPDVPITQRLPVLPRPDQEPSYVCKPSDPSDPHSLPYFYSNFAVLSENKNSHHSSEHVEESSIRNPHEVLHDRVRPSTSKDTVLKNSNLSKQSLSSHNSNLKLSSPIFKHPAAVKLTSNIPKFLPKPSLNDTRDNSPVFKVPNCTTNLSSSTLKSPVFKSPPTKTSKGNTTQSPPTYQTPPRPSFRQRYSVPFSSVSSTFKQNSDKSLLQSSSTASSSSFDLKQKTSPLETSKKSAIPVHSSVLKLRSPIFKLYPSTTKACDSLSKSLTLSETGAPDALSISGCSALESRVITELSYIIVIDFESTCWVKHFGKSYRPLPEIIEFPAVVMNIQTGEIEDQFQKYVMPTEQPKLSDFCSNLTGITQSQVENGVPLKTCLWMFSEWLEVITIERQLVPQGRKGTQFSFVTWTDWDLNICLPNECSRKGLQIPKPLRQWVDLKAVYRDFCGCSPRGLRHSMEKMGLTFEGREHSGLTDALNTARFALALVREGLELHLSVAAMC